MFADLGEVLMLDYLLVDLLELLIIERPFWQGLLCWLTCVLGFHRFGMRLLLVFLLFLLDKVHAIVTLVDLKNKRLIRLMNVYRNIASYNFQNLNVSYFY